jgi:DNA-binding MarR family transcriptional regulator
MIKQFGPTDPQTPVLRILTITGSVSSPELSRKLYVTPASITGIIDRLEKKELVERIRKQEDRRIALITLTQRGAELSKSIPDPVEKKLISELSDLKPDHIQTLGLAVSEILNLIDAKGIEETPLGIDHGARPSIEEEKHNQLY